MDNKVAPTESFKWAQLIRESMKNRLSENESSNLDILVNVQEFDGHEGGITLTDQFHDSAIEIVFLESKIK